MALFSISDLHLPIGINKPMDIFGKQWENYVERLRENWHSVVKPEDLVVMPGDISWATYLEQAVPDFEYLQSLPGRKLILKGNHDYWWTTSKKLSEFLTEHAFDSISFLQNHAVLYGNVALCGSRGWTYGENQTSEDKKIYNREVIRMELSLKEAKQLNPQEIYVFIHYPPTNQWGADTDMTRLFQQYGVTKCLYGHLHAAAHQHAVQGVYHGVEYRLVSADYRCFQPVLLYED